MYESNDLILIKDETNKLKDYVKKNTQVEEKNTPIDPFLFSQNLVKKKIMSNQAIFNFYSSPDYSNIKFAGVKTGIFTYTIKGDNREELATISSNIFSNQFEVYSKEKILLMKVKFCINLLGLYGPLKFYVDIYENENKRTKKYTKDGTKRTVCEFENKNPKYSKSCNCYFLKFYERKITSSVKNFQLILKGEENESVTETLNDDYDDDIVNNISEANDIYFQFAKNKDDDFYCDYKPPFDNLTAFSLALIVLSRKTLCEQNE